MNSHEFLHHNVNFSKQTLVDFCKRHAIRKLAFFGSVLSGDFRPDSDIDVLVEFEPSFIPGLRFFSIEDELTQLLGREVDLSTPNFLSRYFRDQVLEKAETIYERT